MTIDVYTSTGSKKGTATLPSKLFEAPINEGLMHQAVVRVQSNRRNTVANTKKRGEISGSTRKLFQQKGTGRARHGSIRSPLWRGGGVTFGPRNEKDYSKKINKKMRTKALYTVLSQKLRDNEVLFVDALNFDAPKTKDAKAIL